MKMERLRMGTPDRKGQKLDGWDFMKQIHYSPKYSRIRKVFDALQLLCYTW